MNPRTEKAIKAWLKLPEGERQGVVLDRAVALYQKSEKNSDSYATGWELVATFTLRSIIAKRLPRRKKAKAK